MMPAGCVKHAMHLFVSWAGTAVCLLNCLSTGITWMPLLLSNLLLTKGLSIMVADLIADI